MMDLGGRISTTIPPVPKASMIPRINAVLSFYPFASMSSIGELVARHLLRTFKVGISD
jgi:hypothetical protein